MPPFHRKTLVLVGANGVGRRSLKERLIKSDNRRFAAAIPREFNISCLGINICQFFIMTDKSKPCKIKTFSCFLKTF